MAAAQAARRRCLGQDGCLQALGVSALGIPATRAAAHIHIHNVAQLWIAAPTSASGLVRRAISFSTASRARSNSTALGFVRQQCSSALPSVRLSYACDACTRATGGSGHHRDQQPEPAVLVSGAPRGQEQGGRGCRGDQAFCTAGQHHTSPGRQSSTCFTMRFYVYRSGISRRYDHPAREAHGPLPPIVQHNWQGLTCIEQSKCEQGPSGLSRW